MKRRLISIAALIAVLAGCVPSWASPETWRVVLVFGEDSEIYKQSVCFDFADLGGDYRFCRESMYP